MSAVMDLEEARRVLKGRHGSIDRLGPDNVRHAQAAATLLDHYQANRHELRPVALTIQDAEFDRPRYARDATARATEESRQPEDAKVMASKWLPTRDQQSTEVGQPAGGASPVGITPGANATGRVGAKLVQRLPGPVSSYFISTDTDGSGTACLFQSADITDLGDTHQTAVLDQRRVRAHFEYEAAKSKARLQKINRDNAAFWSKHERRA